MTFCTMSSEALAEIAAQDILPARDRFGVSGLDAGAVSAEMIGLQTRRHGADQHLVGDPMG